MSKEELEAALEKESNEETVEETTYTAAEEKAMSSGWRPQEEWTGEAEAWRS